MRKILVKSTPEIDLKTGRVKVHSNGYKLLDEGPTDYVESGKEAKPEINPETGRVKVHAQGYKLQNDASDRSRAYKIGEVTPTTNSPPISCHDRADREDILVSIASTFYAQLLRETFMRSFYTCRSQKHKNTVKLSCQSFFPISSTVYKQLLCAQIPNAQKGQSSHWPFCASVKAAHKMLLTFTAARVLEERNSQSSTPQMQKTCHYCWSWNKWPYSCQALTGKLKKNSLLLWFYLKSYLISGCRTQGDHP